MATITAPGTSTRSSLFTPEERLKLWQRAEGVWKHRTPDPVKKLETMRQEWDHDVPAVR
jgi:hypothetical protein